MDAERVHQFHNTAPKAVGTDNGAPRPRAHDDAGYYAVFVRDLAMGISLEGTCRNYQGGEVGTGGAVDE